MNNSPSLTLSLAHLASFFPLADMDAILRLFLHLVHDTASPDLILASIVLGYFENNLHTQREADSTKDEPGFPCLTFEAAERLYQQFSRLVMEHLECSEEGEDGTSSEDEVKPCRPETSREMIKSISEMLWKQLSRNYQKEKTHIQSIYSFLTENKLDSFGLAYAVVAVCHQLGFTDVTMALSEDHAWVVFGPDGSESAELTCRAEEKRGLGIEDGPDGPAATSWLYLNGHPVLCRPLLMSVAAAVTSINPDNCQPQLGALKRRLLWLLHEEAVESPIQNYPLALLNLADLEAICPGEADSPHAGHRSSPEQLYLQAIEVNRRAYANKHVYPYTYTAGFYQRAGRMPEALRYWADAAQVMSNYNYHREDEEIYKEFREIAEYQMPRLFQHDPSLRQDPTCLAHVLRFYDGICQWEEGSVTPVLHTVWADRFMSTLFKFDAAVRREIVLLDEESVEEEEEDAEEEEEKKRKEEKEKEAEEEEERKKKEEEKKKEILSAPPVTLDMLKAECGNQLFNPAYLLGLVRSPAFLPHDHPDPMLELSPLHLRPPSPTKEEEKEAKEVPLASISPLSTSNASSSPKLPFAAASPPPAQLHLRSEKMRGLRALLTSPRLNGSAIKLQLTAQSQIYLRRTDLDSAYPFPRKRARRN